MLTKINDTVRGTVSPLALSTHVLSAPGDLGGAPGLAVGGVKESAAVIALALVDERELATGVGAAATCGSAAS